MLSIKTVNNFFTHKFDHLKRQYQKHPNNYFAERYFNIVLSLNDFYTHDEEYL